MEATEAEAMEPVREVTREEAWQMFDDEVRRRLNMSAEEFIEKYDSGYWPDPDGTPNLMFLLSLREFAE